MFKKKTEPLPVQKAAPEPVPTFVRSVFAIERGPDSYYLDMYDRDLHSVVIDNDGDLNVHNEDGNLFGFYPKDAWRAFYVMTVEVRKDSLKGEIPDELL